MDTPQLTRQAQPSLKRAFVRNRRGSVAVEFAMLAIPFAMLTFAILESCVSFAASQVLANATDDVARQLRTGQIKPSEFSADALKDKICVNLKLMVGNNCKANVKVDLRKVDSFSEAANLKIAFSGTGKDRTLSNSNFTFSPGPAMTKNTLRVFYEWPVITNFIAGSLSNMKGNKILHYSSVTWQNEPFDD
ncbi:MAG: TadE/TadG family type IV pilus assembly protein [Mesorhizobium sp.]